MRRFDAGELTLAALSAEDFGKADAEESYSEGIIDHLRAVQGTKLAALVRELTSGERKGQHKVSLRATDDDVDVSVIARAQGGGGHRRAAGFSTTLELDELIAFLRRELAVAAARHPGRPRDRDARLNSTGKPVDGILLIDKPAGMTSHDVVAAVRRALGGVKTGHAGTLDPFATGLLIVLVGKATKAQRQMMELRKRYETVARSGSGVEHGGHGGGDHRDGAPAGRSAGCCRRARSDSARRGTRPSRSVASVPTSVLGAASSSRCPSGS